MDAQKIIEQVQSYWTVLIVVFLGASLSFNIGYFQPLLGNSPYLVSVEDLTKSFMYVFVLYMILQNIFFLMDDVKAATTKWSLILVTVIAICLMIFPPAIGIYSTYDTSQNAEFYYHLYSLFVRIAALFFLVFFFVERKRNPSGPSVFSTFIGVMFTFGIAYLFGIMTFYSDSRSLQPVELVMQDAKTESGHLLTSRTSFIVKVKLTSCEFEIVPMQSVRSMRVLLPRKNAEKHDLIDRCFD